VSRFKEPLLRSNVVDLAVGTVFETLVEDLIAPLIDAFGGVPDFFRVGCTSHGGRFATGELTNVQFSDTVPATFRQRIS
jgi:large conductance mechanosensitive channel